MARLTLDISMSLDGFIAGPNQTLEQPLGDGGELLHEWLFALANFRERHGLSGGETNADDEVLDESLRATGAVVMGREELRSRSSPTASKQRWSRLAQPQATRTSRWQVARASLSST